MRKRYKVIIAIAILLVFLLVGSIILISYLTAPKILIEIDPSGRLYVKTNIDPQGMCVYWETDAGSIKPAIYNNNLKYQPDNAYFCYTGGDETALWDIKDYDGHDYSTATIRAYLYKPAESSTKYYLGKTIGSNEITVGKVGRSVQVSGKRIFGNPVRADGQTEWSQLFQIYDHPSVVMLRYRTGAVVEKNNVIQWESTLSLLCPYKFNGLPLDSIKSLEGANTIKKGDTAFLYFDGYNYYQPMDKSFNHETGETIISVKAFIYDQKRKTEKNVSEIQYLYNVESKKHTERNE